MEIVAVYGVRRRDGISQIGWEQDKRGETGKEMGTDNVMGSAVELAPFHEKGTTIGLEA